jgi:signal transduction histidine kinase
MKKIQTKKISIRSRILFMMMTLIIVVFVLVMSVFNLLVNNFIKTNIQEQFSDITHMVTQDSSFLKRHPPPGGLETNQEPDIFPDMRRIPREPIGKAESLILSNQYEILFPEKSMYFIRNYDEIILFAEELKKEAIDLQQRDIRKRNSSGHEYYYVSIPIPETIIQNPSFFVYLIDMTPLKSFSDQINLYLLLVLLTACLLAVGSAIFLSGVIARPVKELTLFAERIGQGDFSRTDLNYQDKELSQLAESMNKAAHQLDSYDQEQKVFFQNASHELRTPLQAIKCNAEGIKKEILPVQKSSDIIIDETNRLTEMVDDLLYTSYIDTTIKDIKWEEQDLREILSNSIERLTSLTKEKRLKLEFDFDEQPVLMRCEEKRLNRAFTNILTNAIRYTTEKIILTCHSYPDKITLSIQDDGDGISEKDFPHIFTRFYAGKKGNHGIGLSIVKSVIEQHHGIIEVKSTESGTTFSITFPRK